MRFRRQREARGVSDANGGRNQPLLLLLLLVVVLVVVGKGCEWGEGGAVMQ